MRKFKEVINNSTWFLLSISFIMKDVVNLFYFNDFLYKISVAFLSGSANLVICRIMYFFFINDNMDRNFSKVKFYKLIYTYMVSFLFLSVVINIVLGCNIIVFIFDVLFSLSSLLLLLLSLLFYKVNETGD